MKVPDALIPEVYSLAKKVYEGKIKRKDAINLLTTDSRMNPSTAGDLINNFRRFMMAARYERTNNTFVANFFLNSIFRDYGYQGLSNAIKALKLHIEYYEDLQKTTMHKQREILDRYSKLLDVTQDEIEQTEIIENYRHLEKSKQEIVNELSRLKPSDPELVTIQGKTYKRDNRTIASIKMLRDFKCQICEEFIIKKDGSPYIEAAHIKPKCQKGTEMPDNILILCPNHHKEFDLGDLQIIEYNGKMIHFILNGEEHKLKIGTRF